MKCRAGLSSGSLLCAGGVRYQEENRQNTTNTVPFIQGPAHRTPRNLLRNHSAIHPFKILWSSPKTRVTRRLASTCARLLKQRALFDECMAWWYDLPRQMVEERVRTRFGFVSRSNASRPSVNVRLHKLECIATVASQELDITPQRSHAEGRLPLSTS
eukprot:COSAG02_NODE_3307_length_6959_cov_9.594898_4_plen_158_part_00